MQKSNYSIQMSFRDFFQKPEPVTHSGEDIHKVISGVHTDYEEAKSKKRDPELTIYYRDLLTFLIKTYGH